MKIVLVNAKNFGEAVAVYAASWRESHRHICTPQFLEKRDYAGYLVQKMERLYLVVDQAPVGVFCLDGDMFGDLYIHPDAQGKGYGTACVQYAQAHNSRLRLSVLSNNYRAIHLYEKSGFRFTGNDVLLREGLWEREMQYTEKNYG